jgi:hypothetical protein
MRFFEILVLAVIASWFLCNERVDTAKETCNDDAASGEGNAMGGTEDDVKETEAAEPDTTLTETRAAWGAIAALVIVVVSFL